MVIELFREVTLGVTRRLPRLDPSHPCAWLHGHTFRIPIHVHGELQPEAGWVMDFDELDRRLANVRAAFDHRVLNDIPGLENPTAELPTRWIWDRLKPQLPGLNRILVQENPFRGCPYMGEPRAR